MFEILGAARTTPAGLITNSAYTAKVKEWAQAAGKAVGSGGNYFATNAAYLGEAYMRLVFGNLYKERNSVEQAAEYLGVKTGSVTSLESYLSGGGEE